MSEEELKNQIIEDKEEENIDEEMPLGSVDEVPEEIEEEV